MSTNKRIAKNTLMLYFRQFITMFVALYTVRVVLDVLGTEDYGLYNVIGGFVAMFSVLQASLGMAAQRYTSFAIGEGDDLKLKQTFSTNLVVYVSISIITYLVLQTAGQWYIEHRLSIPPARYEAVKLVYQFSILSFAITIISTPFRSSIMAHEDMQIYAYLSIFEACIKLVVVWLLSLWSADKLVVYGVLLFFSSSLISFIYAGICIRKYSECQVIRLYWNRQLFKDMMSFSGWSLFGQLSNVARKQAITILINQSFNPAVVAARAIAENITTRVFSFSMNFMAGLNPPMIKAYASGKMDEFYKLIYDGARVAFFLMWVFSLPLILEMNFVLGLWLKNPPEYSELLTILSLVEVLILSISLPVGNAARAPGKMRNYELILGTMQFLVFGGAWIAIRQGGEVYWVYISAIIVNILMFFIRLVLVRTLTGLPIRYFITKVMLPMMGVGVSSAALAYLSHYLLPASWLSSFATMSIAVLTSCISMYYMGLTDARRLKIRTFMYNKYIKLIESQNL